MKLDRDTKTVVKVLIEEGVFNPRLRSINLIKLLDARDNKVDMWLLEVAVRNSIRFICHALGRPARLRQIDGIVTLAGKRHMSIKEFVTGDEYTIIYGFIDSIVEDEINQ